MAMRMEGEVSIVTGSTSGLGEATVRRFASEGARVIVTGRNDERGNAVAESIRSEGGEAQFVAADLGDEASIEGLAKASIAAYGKLTNVVMNAAATATHTGERGLNIETLDNDILERSIAANVRGLLWLFKYTLPRLAEAARPADAVTTSVVTIGTAGTRNGAPGMPAYFATKAPVEVMTRSMAVEYGGRGVRVNCVSSGLVETESEMGAMTPEFRKYVLGLNALPYFGQPEDIANACLFLSSQEARYITGATLCVTGGASS